MLSKEEEGKTKVELSQEDKTKAETVLLLLFLLAVAFICIMAIRIESKYNKTVQELNKCKSNDTVQLGFLKPEIKLPEVFNDGKVKVDIDNT